MRPIGSRPGSRVFLAAGGAAPLTAAPAAQGTSGSSESPDGRVALHAARVLLNPRDATRVTLGEFTFTGGLDLTTDAPALHGLSDLDVAAGNRLTAVSDSDAGSHQRTLLVTFDWRWR